MRVVGVSGSPESGRTVSLVEAVLDGAAEAGARTELFDLGRLGQDRIAELATGLEADAVVLGTPMYRATYTGLLKDFLDLVPREMKGDRSGPLRARATAVVATGASKHHFLGLDPLVAMLSRFFGAFVVPAGAYADASCFDEDKRLADPRVRAHAQALGRTLVALAAAIEERPDLASIGAQL